MSNELTAAFHNLGERARKPETEGQVRRSVRHIHPASPRGVFVDCQSRRVRAVTSKNRRIAMRIYVSDRERDSIVAELHDELERMDPPAEDRGVYVDRAALIVRSVTSAGRDGGFRFAQSSEELDDLIQCAWTELDQLDPLRSDPSKHCRLKLVR